MERDGERDLKSYALLGSKLTEICSHTNENSCNADAACSWCKSAAVKPACRDLKSAKALPAAVFSCSKIHDLKKPVFEKKPAVQDCGNFPLNKCHNT